MVEREERYSVEERLGEETFFAVCRGRDRRSARSVVIKLLKSEFASDESFGRSFLEGAKKATRLSHPGLVKVLDAGELNGRPFVACEWRPGTTLRQKLLVEGRIEPRQALMWAAQIARALAAIHAIGEVHGDIRPEHVVLCGPEGAKLKDQLFSLPFISHPVFREYWLQRSVPYVAPEVLQGGRPGPLSDVYSLAIMLYEMLVGKLPFSGNSVGQVLIKHFREEPPSLLEALPSMPLELDNLLRRCLEKRPGARPSAAEVAERLTEILAKVRSQLPERPAPVVRPSGREGGLTLLLLTSVLRACVWTMGVAMGIGIILGLLYLTWRLTTPKEVTVPYVIGMPLVEADRVMRQHNLKLRWAEEEYSDHYSPGTVIRTDPPPGQRVREGREVKAVISKGPEQVEVPNVVGLPLEGAKREIKASGLSLREVTKRYDSIAPLGEVIEQWPQPGMKLAKNEGVSLVVSKGPGPEEERVESPPEVEEGGVKWAIVEVTVPPGEGKQGIRIEVEDAYGIRTVFDQFRSPGEKVSVQVSGRGRMIIRVYLNEELVEEKELK